jgi:hypothetical protein
MESADGNDTFVALLRSAADDTGSAAALYVAMQERSDEVYRRLLDEHDMRHRLPFVAALLVGVTFSRYVVQAGALAEMSAEQLIADLTASLEALLHGNSGTEDPPVEQGRGR